MTLKELVGKEMYVQFSHFRQGEFYYELKSNDFLNDTRLQFCVPLEDVGTATMLSIDKAITFMRWIRKAQDSNTLIDLIYDKKRDIQEDRVDG